jgi:hypothetical protein
MNVSFNLDKRNTQPNMLESFNISLSKGELSSYDSLKERLCLSRDIPCSSLQLSVSETRTLDSFFPFEKWLELLKESNIAPTLYYWINNKVQEGVALIIRFEDKHEEQFMPLFTFKLDQTPAQLINAILNYFNMAKLVATPISNLIILNKSNQPLSTNKTLKEQRVQVHDLLIVQGLPVEYRPLVKTIILRQRFSTNESYTISPQGNCIQR